MRLMEEDLTQNANNVQEESEIEYTLSVCKKAKLNTNSSPHSCDGFSRTSSAMERAQEVQANLVSEAPSFIKTLTKSQVRGHCVRLGMPRDFCKEHMPKLDTTIVLVDENENEYITKYTMGKSGWESASWLSDGWRCFSVAHKLAEGDVVVFQLIEPFKFKVYIVRALENLDCHHAEDQNNVIMERAQEVQANLVSEAPSFIKTLTKSQVRGLCVKMVIPREFCRLHMPKVDKTIVLVDENENEYKSKYTTSKGETELSPWLSDGWRCFSDAHKLMEGDVLVFQLIEPLKFKVYIVRALENLNCDHAEAQNNDIRDQKRQKCIESPVINSRTVEDSLLSDGDNCVSEIMQGIQLFKSNFKDVMSFEDFSTHVNGLILNSDQISVDLREKYYKLCCSQNMFLHENLTEGYNNILATGIISETINIADAIRAAKSSTSLNQLESWDKTLKAFEDLGMVVGFLRARIDKLISLSNAARAKTNERNKSVELLKFVEEELGNLSKLAKGLDAEFKEHDSVFEEVSSASW